MLLDSCSEPHLTINAQLQRVQPHTDLPRHNLEDTHADISAIACCCCRRCCLLCLVDLQNHASMQAAAACYVTRYSVARLLLLLSQQLLAVAVSWFPPSCPLQPEQPLCTCCNRIMRR